MLAVEVQNLTHSINNKKILNNINFNLNKDSISCILGPSGSCLLYTSDAADE